MKASETTLVDLVAEFLQQQGGRVFKEVANLGQSADIVFFQDKDLMFVEVKVNATSRAIEQCRTHELVADFICVAIGGRTVNPSNLEKMKNLGYGLISCHVETGDCRWVLHPQRQQKYWQPIRQKLIKRIAGDEAYAD